MEPFDKLSNARKTTVKKILIKSIEQEIQNKFLQPKFKILQKDNSVKYLDQLKPINITKARFISMKILILQIYLRNFRSR